jgi:hypothetical protein
MKFLLSIIFLIFIFSSFSSAEQGWIKKKEQNKWIQKKDTKKIEWITKKNKNDDLVFITLLPLFFAIFYIKKIYDK